MPSGPSSRSEMEIELSKLSSPRIFLVRMLVFLVLCTLITVVLYKQIIAAFFANPGLNALIVAVLLIGIILSFRQVIRLYPEVAWVNSFRIADPGLAIERRATLLASRGAVHRSGRTRWRRWRRSAAASAPGGGRSRSRPCGICWTRSRRGWTRPAISPAT